MSLMKPELVEILDGVKSEVETARGTFNNLDGRLDDQDLNIGTISQISLFQQQKWFLAGTGKNSINIDTDIRNSMKVGQSGVKIKGFTACNELKNGNFDSLTGWSFYSGTPSLANNIATNTSNGSAVSHAILTHDLIKQKTGHKFYQRGFAKVSGNAINIRLRAYSSNDATILTPTPNMWYMLSGIAVINTAVESGGGYIIEIAASYPDAATANGKTLSVKELMSINLTAIFGEGNEPTKEQCDIMYDHYIEGIQGVGNFKILSLGKNMFSPINGTVNTSSGYVLLSTRITNKDNGLIRVKPNTTYVLSIDSPLLWHCYEFDSYKNLISTSDWSATPVATAIITTSQTTTSIGLSLKINDTDYINPNSYKIQFEEGSVPTTFETYKTSEVNVSMPTGMAMHRLPNGTVDISEIVDGTNIFINKTKKVILQATDIVALNTADRVNYDEVHIHIPDSYVSTSSVQYQGRAIILGYDERAYSDTAVNIGTWFKSATDGYFKICVPKGTYGSLDAAKIAFTGLQIVYELATPMIYYNNYSIFKMTGSLETFTNGSIMQVYDIIKQSVVAPIEIIYNLTEKAVIYQNSKALSQLFKNSIMLGTEYNPNLIINGDFQVWQRGISQTGNGYGSDDRWVHNNIGSSKVHSRQAFPIGQTDVPGNPTYFSRTVVTSVVGASNYVQNATYLEDVARFSGKTVTLSFWAKADGNKKISIDFVQYFGIGGSPTVEPIGLKTFLLTTTWAMYTLTVTLPSVTGKTITSNDSLRLRIWLDAGTAFNNYSGALGHQSGTFDFAMIKLEYGDHDTPFVSRSKGEELALCQRYYIDLKNDYIRQTTYNSNTIWYYIRIGTPMRISPVFVNVTTQGMDWVVMTTQLITQTGFTLNSPISLKDGTIVFTVSKTSHGLTDSVINFGYGALDAEL